MTRSDDRHPRTETVRTPDPAAVLALPALYHVEQDLLELRADLGALHYGIAAFLVRHDHRAADDLTLNEASGNALRKLDQARERIAAARRLAGRGL